MKDKKKEKSDEITIDTKEEAKRLNRIIGQLEGIRKMLEGNRKLEDVLIQCKAVHSALRAVESRVFKLHVEAALGELAKMDKKKERKEYISELEDLFKQAS
jgi:CsoR family transcriptional regulator, copper-sensing transcriptional repressor